VNWALFAVAFYVMLGSLAYISLIGKPRQAVTPSMAIIVVTVNSAFAVLMTLAGLRLS